MLLHQGLINLELVQKLLRWRHTGFNVHSKVRATSKKDTERVGKYMIRPLSSPYSIFPLMRERAGWAISMDLRGGVYLMADFFAFFVVLFPFPSP